VVELLELFGEQTIELANSARLPYVTALAKTFLGTSRPRLRSTERRLRFGKKIHYTLLQDHRLWSPIPRAALGSTQKLKNEAFQRFFVVSKRCPARCQSITTPNVCKPNPRSLQSPSHAKFLPQIFRHSHFLISGVAHANLPPVGTRRCLRLNSLVEKKRLSDVFYLGYRALEIERLGQDNLEDLRDS
jgi:hypothetical protein